MDMAIYDPLKHFVKLFPVTIATLLMQYMKGKEDIEEAYRYARDWTENAMAVN